MHAFHCGWHGNGLHCEWLNDEASARRDDVVGMPGADGEGGTPMAGQERDDADPRGQQKGTVAAVAITKSASSPSGPSDNLATLERVTLFTGLDAEALHDLAAVVRRRTFRPGEVIFHRDDPGQVLYVIQNGKVKIYLTS